MNEHAELLRLGETVRQVRDEQRLSVDALAARSGIDAQRISNLEAGRLDPEFDVLIALARGLGVRASALVPPEPITEGG
jgi:transcriptional regulator with XRE-family HTH domain